MAKVGDSDVRQEELRGPSTAGPALPTRGWEDASGASTDAAPHESPTAKPPRKGTNPHPLGKRGRSGRVMDKSSFTANSEIWEASCNAAVQLVSKHMENRQQARYRLFSQISARALLCWLVGFIVVGGAVALGVFDVVGKDAEWYVGSGGLLLQNIGTMLFCTLPPSKFDFDLALVRWHGGRRLVMSALILFTAAYALTFPHFTGLATLGVTVACIWTEASGGCCSRCCSTSCGQPRYLFTFIGVQPVVYTMLLRTSFNYYQYIGCATAIGRRLISEEVLNGSIPSSGHAVPKAPWENVTECRRVKTYAKILHTASAAGTSLDTSALVYLGNTAWLVFILLALVLWQTVYTCRQRRGRKRTAMATEGSSPNLTYFVFTTLTVCYTSLGLAFVVEGSLLVKTKFGPPNMTLGICTALPHILALLYGRARIFKTMEGKFEEEQREIDGAFLAALMDRDEVKLGNERWVHHGNMLVDAFPEAHDHRRNWHRGMITKIDTINNRIRVSKSIQQHRFGEQPEILGNRTKSRASVQAIRAQPRSSVGGQGSFLDGVGSFTGSFTGAVAGVLQRTRKNTARVRPRLGDTWEVLPQKQKLNSAALLLQAKTDLRALNGADLTKALMASSVLDPVAAQTIELVRPGQKTKIDFFLSHSWHDNSDAKWNAIQEIKDQFFEATGRQPTFWLDKICIDQDNIGDGLRVLCINVAACRKLLMFCGKTYPQRLWCVLELFMIFAFAGEEEALSRILLVPVEEEGVTQEMLLDQLANFSLDDAHCYDPNEERKLRMVMHGIGEERFVLRIRYLAERIRISARSQPRSQRFSRKRSRVTSMVTRGVSKASDTARSVSSRLSSKRDKPLIDLSADQE